MAINKKQTDNVIDSKDKNQVAEKEALVNVATEPSTGAGTGFESKEDKQKKDDNLERHEVSSNVNTVDKSNASDPVKIVEGRVVEVQREENNILSTKATNNTVTLDSLVSVDASQQNQINPMDLSLNELYEKLPQLEKQAEAEQNYPLAAEFTNICASLGAVVNGVRGLSQAALAFINKHQAEKEDKELKHGQLFVRDTNQK
jgi:uncharacterized coiled-coil protein SlyX